MRRFIAACLLLAAVIVSVSLFSVLSTRPTTVQLTSPLANASVTSDSSLVLAGHCVVLSWNIQLRVGVTGTFTFNDEAVGPVGSQIECGLPAEGFANTGPVFIPANQAPGESYPVSVLVIPTDLRLWILIGLEIGAALLALYLFLPAQAARRLGSLGLFARLGQRGEAAVPRLRLLMIGLCIVAALVYVVTMGWAPGEVLRMGVGFVALWGGLGAVFYLLLRQEIADGTLRFTLSAIASYALTTLFYFVCAVAGLEWLFYAGQVACWGYSLVMAVRLKFWRKLTIQNLLNLDWILIFLILLTMIGTEAYKELYTTDPGNGNIVYRVSNEQLYSAGLAYELARHVPPLQPPSYAGMPERAYHMFPHLTTMLVARYTGQPDMLVAQIPYSYTVFELLICLGVYGLARLLTGSKWAGYFGVAVMYLLAIPWFPLSPSPHKFLYFTLFPHGINGIDLITLTSNQMYSAVPIVYGLLLCVAWIGLRAREKAIPVRLVILAALMAGALLRFRLQFAIALTPVLFLAFVYWAIRTRRWVYLLGAGCLAVTSLALYLEMQSPVYLPSTGSLLILNNGLADTGPDFLYSFPFATQLRGWIYANVSETPLLGSDLKHWAWQFACLGLFALLNIVGIPTLLTFVILFVRQRGKPFFFFFAFLALLVALTIVGGATLSTPYDNYSVGGQILFNPGWYLLPVVPLGLWAVYRYIQRDLRLPRTVWIGLAGVLFVAFLGTRQTVPNSPYMQSQQVSVVIDADTWQVLQYIRDQTPQDSVILSKEWVRSWYYLFSGTEGRISYLENVDGPVELNIARADTGHNRLQLIDDLTAAKDDETFCKLLQQTPITLLVEYQAWPYLVHPAACLEQVMVSTPSQQVILWRVKRGESGIP